MTFKRVKYLKKRKLVIGSVKVPVGTRYLDSAGQRERDVGKVLPVAEGSLRDPAESLLIQLAHRVH